MLLLLGIDPVKAEDEASKPKIYLSFWEVTMANPGIKEPGFDWLIGNQTKSGPISLFPGSRGKFFGGFGKKTVKLASPAESSGSSSVESDLSRRNREYMESFETGKIRGVFTDPQFQVVLRALRKADVEIVLAPAILVDSGQRGVAQTGKREWAAVPELHDGYTIDLEVFLSGRNTGLLQRGDDSFPVAKVAIWDGQVIAIDAGKLLGKQRTVFVQASKMDETGGNLRARTQAVDR